MVFSPPKSKDNPFRLWYSTPGISAVWNEHLPIGYGRLGEMVRGGIPSDMVYINEDSFWSGGPMDRVNPSATESLDRMRPWLLQGAISDATLEADLGISGVPSSMRQYMAGGDFQIVFQNQTGNASSYERWLDLSDGTAGTHYSLGGITYEHEYLASNPADVLADIYVASAYWPMGHVWLLQHVYKHYLYTGNEAFLGKHWQMMLDAAQFYTETLDDFNGWKVTNPSISADNSYKNGNADVALTIGALMEWIEDYEESEPGHRHFSPLYGLFTGSETTPADPKIWNATGVFNLYHYDRPVFSRHAGRYVPARVPVVDEDLTNEEVLQEQDVQRPVIVDEFGAIWWTPINRPPANTSVSEDNDDYSASESDNYMKSDDAQESKTIHEEVDFQDNELDDWAYTGSTVSLSSGSRSRRTCCEKVD
ncbi:glycoside hydrolase family 95 protein [Periconia macrospinosa]|uniref:Glycoside hydrolase family 95 protein n=1 Tax=Periconia macrospinosa TaxID=97972 RepID=A0A2V1E4I4_9PLEO|nr:glycoside hydrolase family 95 protein [Periconia macrospinosa]